LQIALDNAAADMSTVVRMLSRQAFSWNSMR